MANFRLINDSLSRQVPDVGLRQMQVSTMSRGFTPARLSDARRAATVVR